MPLDELNMDDLEFNDPPQLIWVKIRDASNLLWEDNPKLHDMDGIIKSIKTHGFQAIPKFDIKLKNSTGAPGAIKDGNGRVEGLAIMENGGVYELPRGLAIEVETKHWVMPILIGTDAISESMAQIYALDANNIGMMSAENVTAWDIARVYEEDEYKAVLQKILEADENVLPISVSLDDIDILFGTDDGIDPNKEWDGMPEFEHEDKTSTYSIHVHLLTLEDLKAFAELLGQTITEKTRSIWYPEADKINMRSTYQEDDES